MSTAADRTQITELGTLVKPAVPPPPPLFQVVLHNDDYTPMDFVVWVLSVVFGMDEMAAQSLMRRIHEKGRGACGAFGKDVAETKATQVMDMARQHQHPLQVTVEIIPSSRA